MGGGRQQSEAAHGGGLGGADAASCFLGPELQIESQADVGRPAAEARHLCGPAGTDRLGDGSEKDTARTTAEGDHPPEVSFLESIMGSPESIFKSARSHAEQWQAEKAWYNSPVVASRREEAKRRLAAEVEARAQRRAGRCPRHLVPHVPGEAAYAASAIKKRQELAC